MAKAIDSIGGLDQQLRSHLLKHNRSFSNDASAHLPTDIRLRAAMDTGTIRPIWQRFEGRDVPSWEQTSDSNVFVDVARLLEAEAKVGDKQESSLIFKSELAPEVTIHSGLRSIVSRTETVEIKHGRKMNVAIVSLSAIGIHSDAATKVS